jgi:hypothetical protein
MTTSEQELKTYLAQMVQEFASKRNLISPDSQPAIAPAVAGFETGI